MIVIHPYSDEWPALFEAEARSLANVLGGLALRIEHVGSTAVPGLAAKPVIDIQVSVPSLEPRPVLHSALGRLGYHHVDLGDFDKVYPFFAKPRDWPSTHHVHLCVVASEQERRHLAFRDALRARPDLAREYEALKHHLASLHDAATLEARESYSLAKTDFVERVLRTWAARGV